MAHKPRHEVDPERQAQIFSISGEEIDPNPVIPEITTPIEGYKTAGRQIPTTYGKEGSYVDLAERGKNLIGALKAFSESNERAGFDVASNNQPHSSPIWGRYQRETPKVQEGAARNQEAFIEEAKQKFWKATGYSALRRAGLQTKYQTDSNGRKMWRDFSAEYSHTGPVARKRQKYIKKLEKTVARVEKEKKKAA